MIVCCSLFLAGSSYALGPAAKPAPRELGYGQVRYAGHGPEWWAGRARRLRRSRDDLQARLGERVRQVRRLRRALVHKPSSLEALRLAAIAYKLPFELLYRRASCESMGSPPASPASERTLYALARNPSSSAKGLLQFLDSTWASTPYAAESVYSPYANALAAGWMIGVAGRGDEWDCR
jgi:hypothetical protein